ncbi:MULTISPECIES: spore germination protein [Brevibacillus]|jgi:stage V sporulation protein AF|uniref:Spore germination protein n=1 Tax=Brevibacillus parabrevis TaxID=54914 RepID=A0A4Y3PGR4_BREPA|nr:MULTISPECIES: spore germination protein [Brevibacillus]MBU8712090.1 spore germination protein [Brevibacillus parabrevis]MDH6349157.1 stage V sporulation protein AF [Brevibacillus sp. 1238]MDR5001173.1 spore germination protein [Brevibacillus parabrevis]MED2257570.1 spore germination protein [Brevibacillus parabrevis]NRQ52187.1 spore germination protein [Brevibacillus sp. HD1.4A]
MTTVTEKRRPISERIEENKEYLNDRLGVGKSFDIGVHEFFVGNTKLLMYYINGFAESMLVSQIMREINDLRGRDITDSLFETLFYKFIPFYQLAKVDTTDEFMDKLLVGQVGLILDRSNHAIIMDTKILPTRSPQEPDTERIVRGAHDGFTETLVINTVLTRRRIRDERLRFEIMQVGERTKTDVAVAYLQDVANPQLVDELKERLQNIQIDGIPMAEKTIEEFIIGKTLNPFPLVRYTERPDVAAVHLLEGHVLIYVDTSPSVMITPATYFHHVQHAEEYRQTPVVGAYLRWVRFFGIFASVFVLPIWLLMVMHPSMIPEQLDFIGMKDKGSIPLLVQFLLAEVGLDLMRMAAIHTPAPLSVAMGLLAAILVGDVAIKVGLFAPEVILYLAVAAIGMFATPSYELGLANRLVRIFLILMVGFFSTPGLMIGFLAVLVGLAATRSLNTPYLWPFIPFNYKAMKDVVVRLAVPSKNNRPSIVRSQNSSRQ